jgi:dolichol-phosphate mannosyltransferase
MKLSAVIPVYNEVESLLPLHEDICAVAEAEAYDIEMIFVDDGSVDGSWEKIVQLAERDSRVRGVRFRRNFGKAAALVAGFDIAEGDRVITLDADLQDDPAEIPNFLAAIDRGVDVVSGWKKIRHDPWHKVLPSRVFNWTVGWMTGVRLHDHNCGMKCYRGEVLDEVHLYGELHRFVPVLADARGFKVDEIVIRHRERKFGQSKYGVRRLVKGFLDLLTVKFLTGFGQRPQHVLGTVGLASFGLGSLGLLYLGNYWLVAQLWPDLNLTPLHQRPAVIYSMGALLFGGQLISIGFLAEMITAQQSREVEGYSIAERVGGTANDANLHDANHSDPNHRDPDAGGPISPDEQNV